MKDLKDIELNNMIARWLSGEATPKEIALLNEWAAENESNEAYLRGVEKIWDHAGDDELIPDTSRAWDAVRTEIQKPLPKAGRMKIVYRAALAAAACLGLFIAGRMFFLNRNTADSIPVASTGLFIQSGDEVYTTTLGDQTVVRLQPHSTITADTGFGKTNRVVKLKGSAHFITLHGQKHVFTVRTENAQVEDIGTAFWVYESSQKTRVVVTEGSVKLKAYRDSAVLVQGDSAEVLHSTAQVLPSNTNVTQPEVTGNEKDKTLVFIKTELNKVTPLLNTTYHADIRLGNPEIAGCKLTASFKNENLETVLEVIRETFNLEIRKEGDIIYLDGKGCQ